MRRIVFSLFLAAMLAPQGALAATHVETERSAGAHPVVYDDYPESELVIPVTDDIVLTVTGEARVRFEWVENASDFSSNGTADPGDDAFYDDSYSFWPARFNVGFRVDLPRDVAVVTELQGSWDLGSGTEARAVESQYLRPAALTDTFASGDWRPADNGRAFGSTGAPFSGAVRPVRTIANALDTADVQIYQGYIETATIGDSIFSMRFGRQELAYGTEFLLGNQDWYDGMSWDAIKGIFEFTDNLRMDVFWAKALEADVFGSRDDDIDLYGAYISAASIGGSSVGIDGYLLGLDVNTDAVWGLTTDPDDFTAMSSVLTPGETGFMDAYWAGIRVFRDRATGWHWSAELTWLFGDIEALFDNDGPGGKDPARQNVDISAMAFEGFLGYTWDTRTHPTIKANFTYASGSDFGDYQAAEYGTFFTPAGEVHPRLGLMDLVDPSNIVAFSLGYAGHAGNHSWGVDLWHFELDEVDPFVNTAYLAAELDDRDGRGFDDELGQELDLWYNYQYSENMVAQFAVGWFNAGDFIESVNRCANGCDDDLVGDDPVGTDDAWRIYANLLVRF